MEKVLCVCLNPAVQRTMEFRTLVVGQINRATKVETHVGGKGMNVARALRQLGVADIVLCFLGGRTGEMVKEQFQQQEIPLRYVETHTSTRICTTLLDVQDHIQTELVEEGAAVTETEVDTLRHLFGELLQEVAMVTISGTAPPGVPETLYAEWVALAYERKIPTIVDAPGQWLMKCLTSHPLLLKPNWQELEKALGGRFSDSIELKSALSSLADQYQHAATRWVISRGAEGVYVMEGDKSYRFVPPPVSVVNPIGSGDAMTAGIVAALLRGEAMQQAIRFGIACGAANVLTPLVGWIKPEDVQTLYPQVQEVPF